MNEGQAKQAVVVCPVCKGFGRTRPAEPTSPDCSRCAGLGVVRAAADSAQPPLEDETRFRLQRAGYPLRSLEEFAQLLMKHKLMDECAWFDPEGYDGGATLERLSRAFHEATDNAALQRPPDTNLSDSGTASPGGSLQEPC